MRRKGVPVHARDLPLRFLPSILLLLLLVASSEAFSVDLNVKMNAHNMPELSFRPALARDLPSCLAVETASYPADEAASEESLVYRQAQAGEYFRCAEISGGNGEREIVGFICSTRCREFAHESMSTHTPEGPLLAIHSVVVTEKYRRQGIATAMLKEYVAHLKRMQHSSIQQIVLLAKQHLLGFYVDCGFSVDRPSAIVHGSEQWYDLSMDMDTNNLRSSASNSCYILDSFVNPESPAGTGNPAAIVLCSTPSVITDTPEEQKWMQTVAAEFNLSETAFVWPMEKTPSDSSSHQVSYGIRYYTPTQEIDLCGHATLAAAAMLFQTAAAIGDEEVAFYARQDVLRAVQKRETNTGRRQTQISMHFPVMSATELDAEAHEAVVAMVQKALGIQDSASILYTGFSSGLGDLLVEISPDSFAKIDHDRLELSAFLDYQDYSRGVIVCCKAPADAKKLDFLSRFFGPKAGIDEDPVTGSAHCALAPYFAEKLNKQSVVGFQQSARGGVVQCRLDTKPSGEQAVELTGTAALVVRGALLS